jgi:hypothetical protein
MTYVGIVGHEGAKFEKSAELMARLIIRELLAEPDAILVSGHCHLGGIDIWAEEEAQRLGRSMVIYPPKRLTWDGGFRPRNIQIATLSDIVHCIVVRELPLGFTGRRHQLCYHCNRKDHVKSGGCWTAKHAEKLGKPAHWHVIP